jgi:hypothetical protein
MSSWDLVTQDSVIEISVSCYLLTVSIETADEINSICIWRHDTQHYDTQNNDIQDNDTQHNKFQ